MFFPELKRDATAATENASVWATGYGKWKYVGAYGVNDSDCVIHLTARRARQTFCTAGPESQIYLWFIPVLSFGLFVDDCIRLPTFSYTVPHINLTGIKHFTWQDIVDQVLEWNCHQPNNIGRGKPLWSKRRPSESPSDDIGSFMAMLNDHGKIGYKALMFSVGTVIVSQTKSFTSLIQVQEPNTEAQLGTFKCQLSNMLISI